jgi:hypothetical protein
MKEIHKGKLYICYKGAPTANSRNQPQTKVTNGRLLEGDKKGLTPPAIEQRSAKLISSP